MIHRRERPKKKVAGKFSAEHPHFTTLFLLHSTQASAATYNWFHFEQTPRPTLLSLVVMKRSREHAGPSWGRRKQLSASNQSHQCHKLTPQVGPQRYQEVRVMMKEKPLLL